MTIWRALIKVPHLAGAAEQTHALREQLPVLVGMMLDEGADADELERALDDALAAIEDHDGG